MKYISSLFLGLAFTSFTVSAIERNVSNVAELRTAISNAQAGDIILLNGGTYTFTAKLEIKNKVGTAQNKFTLMANPNSATRPLFDFSAMAEDSNNQGLVLNGCNYWHIKGIDIYKAGDNGMHIRNSNNNVIEFCTFFECSDSGLQIDNGAANNLILNCDSYYNADSSLENADGFACKLNVGSGNVFRGCRAWQNLDDGWDGYLRDTDNITTTYENCWAFDNGKLKNGVGSGGDGNGFKTGGSDDKLLKHNGVLKNCIAAGNVVKGFDHNSNRGEVTLYNCAAYSNGQSNMGFGNTNRLSKLTIKNTLVLGSTGSINADVLDVTHNSWNSNPAITVNNASFESIAITDLKLPRKSDGSLPDIGFLKPISTSSVIDKGVNLGLPYKGTAPDIGVFEYDPNLPLNLLNFNAKIENTQSFSVKISWTTSNEINTRDFEILRKGGTGDYKKIHTQLAVNQSGLHQYCYTDNFPLNGHNYYQLKQNDKDGKFTYSEIVSAEIKEAFTLHVYPNPLSETLNIIHDAAGNATVVKILGLDGKLYFTIGMKVGSSSTVVDISKLASGTYLVFSENEGKKSTVKFIKN